MNSKKLAAFVLLLMVAGFASAAVDATSIVGTLQASMLPAISKLTTTAIGWLAAFSALQFFITNFAVIKSGGDIEVVIGKLAASVGWIGVCFYLINHGPQFISDVGQQFFDILGFTFPTPGSIIGNTLATGAALSGIAFVVGVGSTTGGMLIMYVMFAIVAIGMFFAFKILMLQIEIALVAMLSPLSFAFLGLSALKDQGIAPFKALISLAYRILLLSIFMSAFTEVSNAVSLAALSLNGASILVGSFADSIQKVLAALGAYIVLVYFVWKSDAIAASLAGGSTSMGTGDIAGAAAAGAAAGAAIASGGASLAAAGSSAPASMSEFMKSLGGGGGGSVSNASASGVGANPVGTAPTPPVAASPMFSTRKDGSPTLPSGGPDSKAASGAQPDGAPPSSTSTSAGASGPSAADTKTAQDFAKAPEPTTPQTSTGSGSSAGIGGPGESSRANMDDVLKAVGQIGQGNKKSAVDHLASANQQIAQERAATHVSINTHQSD